jgi:uncharacterized membrane protein
MKSDFRENVLKEIDEWLKDGLISGEQARVLSSRYSLARMASEKSAMAKIITVLSIFGAVLVGVGVILFFAANWRGIPAGWKLSLILLSIFSAYSIGYALGFGRGKYPKIARALIFLGSLLFGAGIYLVAQIYHFPANYPGGVLFWALGILPVAYLLRLKPVVFLCSLLLVLWNILRVTSLDEPNYYYLLFAALVFYLVYKLGSSRLVFINLLGLVAWFASHLYFWNKGVDVYPGIIIFLNLGTLFYIIGRIHAIIPRLAGFQYAYKVFGIFLVLVSTYFLGRDFTYYIFPAAETAGFSRLIAVNCAVLIVAFAALIYNNFKQPKSRVLTYEFYGLALIMAVGGLGLIFPSTVNRFAFHLGKKGFMFLPFVFNLMLFLEIIAAVVLGYIFREAGGENLGVIFFVVQVITLYFSFFWMMLSRSLFFIGGGLILLVGGGYLEKKRKDIIARIKSEGRGK